MDFLVARERRGVAGGGRDEWREPEAKAESRELRVESRTEGGAGKKISATAGDHGRHGKHGKAEGTKEWRQGNGSGFLCLDACRG